MIALTLVATATSRAQSSSSDPDPHAHHHGAAPPAPASPSGPGSAPSRASTISTPSWFAGGESLYVPPYYDSFKGLDLTQLTASQKEHFLHRANTEFCSCNQTGCHRDTIAHCYVTDLACPRAPVRIREMLEMAKAETAGAAAAAPSVTITPRP